MRLAMHDLACSNKQPRLRQSGGADSDLGQRPGAGCHDGPAVRRQSCEELERARKRHHSIEVFYFAALDHEVLLVMVGVRQILPDGSDAGPPMRIERYLYRIKT